MSANSQAERAALAQAAPLEVLTLCLGAEAYAIDIMVVQEIRSFEAPTRLAQAPAHVLGVCNLRGVIVPVMDLRRHLGLDASVGPSTVTVVVNVGGRTVGLVVDSVSDVVLLAPEQIKPAPTMASGLAAQHLTGLATHQQGEHTQLLILLDVCRFLADL